MKNETSYQSEAEMIRQAEQERSKAIAEFFTRLFSRHESANLPLNPIPQEARRSSTTSLGAVLSQLSR